jgi:hypothetical protein
MKDPAVLFYTGDFLNGCLCLTMEERGQYITLLCLQHQSGHLSEKTIRLSLGSVSVDVMAKFKKDENGLYFNERMEIETAKRLQFLDSRRINGAKGGRPKNNDETEIEPYAKPYGKANINLSENRNINENININIDENEEKIHFDFFWNLYNKKVGDKSKCQKKWDLLSENEKLIILDSLPDFLSQYSDKQYQPYPETYLNQKRWNDEIILKNNNNGKNGNGASWGEITDIIKNTFGAP